MGTQMVKRYIAGKGYLVGEFTDAELAAGLDRRMVEKAKRATGCKYVNTVPFKRNGKIGGLRIYVCRPEDAHI